MINARSSWNSASFLNMPQKMFEIKITEVNEDEEESKEISSNFGGSFNIKTNDLTFDESNPLEISFRKFNLVQ